MSKRDRTKVRRSPQKQTHDQRVIQEIISRAIIAHVAIAVDGQPFAIPVACAPYGQELLLHGSTASRLFKVLAEGAPACVTITHLQALVLAASAFDSSMHYQSLMAFGAARVLDSDEKVSDAFPDLPLKDPSHDLWVGILPISSRYGNPVASVGLDSEVQVPSYISRWPINRI